MKKAIVYFISVALLFGLSLSVCNAQNSKKKTPTKKTVSSKVASDEGDDSTKVSVKNKTKKQPVRKPPIKSKFAIEKEKDDSIKNYYESQLQQQQKKNEETVVRLQNELNAKALLEQQLAEKDQQVNQTKTDADAQKAYSDSMAKELLATKIILQVQENENAKKEVKNVKVEAPVVVNSTIAVKQENPIINSAKEVKPKPAMTHVVATMSEKGWVSAKEKKLVPMPKKGTLVDDGKAIYVRESDVNKFPTQINSAKSQKRTIHKVRK